MTKNAINRSSSLGPATALAADPPPPPPRRRLRRRRSSAAAAAVVAASPGARASATRLWPTRWLRPRATAPL